MMLGGNKWRAHLETNWALNERKIWLRVRRPDGRALHLVGVEVVDGSDADAIKPFLTDTREERLDGLSDIDGLLQAIVDVAWEAGIQPVQMKGQSGELAAVRYHLEDMRTLALKLNKEAE